MKGNYKIEIKKSAVKEIKSLPENYLQRILKLIKSLSVNPRPHNCKKLSGKDNYRIRIGVYRIIYSINDDKLVVYIIKVGHRRNVYK